MEEYSAKLVMMVLVLAFAYYGMAADGVASVVTEQEKMEFLAAHNDARSQATPTPEVALLPLEWNDTLADYAKNHMERCKFEHSDGDGAYGENLAWSNNRTITPAEVVGLWVDERSGYDYDSHTCSEGKTCGHYTQVVWRDSTAIGCERTPTSCGQDSIIYMCCYYPRGNWLGERPY